mmetsp:Transcript_14473/g.31813  ORF Transcript_14473/g.31813 Transcript_14473/m.31813 type:complete len:646 (-) Transcript_14473:825-2762(-)
MQYFIRKMNEAADMPLTSKYIDRDILVDFFHEIVLAAAVHIDPTVGDAAEVFDVIDDDEDGYIDAMDLHGPIMEDFLNDAEIHNLVRKFRTTSGTLISKENFLKHYAIFLEEVISDFSQGNFLGEKRGMNVEFRNLSLAVRVSSDQEIKVVNSVSGSLQEGTMTALLGGSGTGKTSLLNALSGRAFYGDVTGTILINGHRGKIEDHGYPVGYVPQDDLVHGELTVRENLIFAGRFRLPANTSMKEVSELADGVIANLGLAKVRDSIVGDMRVRGISGGEKKRVNIGIELMARPNILFLDEPTSGLDSSSSSLVMSCLKNMVMEIGVTVACVIHQPRKFIFDLFDSVILLVPGGEIIYEGHPDLIESYFNKLGYVLPPGENVADWIVDISSCSIRLPTSNFGSRHPKFIKKSLSVSSGITRKQLFDDSKKSSRERKFTREFLAKQWKKNKNRFKHDEETVCSDITKSTLVPEKVDRPSFLCQLETQIQRNVLIMYRNRFSKLIDTIMLLFAVLSITAIDGTLELVLGRFQNQPMIVPMSILQSKHADILPLDKMFQPYQVTAQHMLANGLKVGTVASVLVGLSATKYFSEKQLEFFRESSSGYNINAYFLGKFVICLLLFFCFTTRVMKMSALMRFVQFLHSYQHN